MFNIETFQEFIPINEPMCQQEMRACRPNFIYYPTTFLLTFSCIHLALAIFIGVSSYGWHEAMIRYDNICQEGQICNISFNTSYKLEKPVFVYYQLDRFYQGHFRFRQSINYKQLAGKNPELSSCYPRITYPNNSTTLAPCGLRAYYMFHDKFSINSTSIRFNNITWESEKNHLYKTLNANYANESHWLRQYEENETLSDHFEIWMRTSPSPKLRKLYGVINEDIPAGQHHVEISMDTPNSVYKYGRKLVLVSQSASGGRYLTLIGINCLICTVYVFSALTSAIMNNRMRNSAPKIPRRDSAYLQ